MPQLLTINLNLCAISLNTTHFFISFLFYQVYSLIYANPLLPVKKSHQNICKSDPLLNLLTVCRNRTRTWFMFNASYTSCCTCVIYSSDSLVDLFTIVTNLDSFVRLVQWSMLPVVIVTPKHDNGHNFQHTLFALL